MCLLSARLETLFSRVGRTPLTFSRHISACGTLWYQGSWRIVSWKTGVTFRMFHGTTERQVVCGNMAVHKAEQCVCVFFFVIFFATTGRENARSTRRAFFER